MGAENYREYNEKKYRDYFWKIDRSKRKWFSNYVRFKILKNWVQGLPLNKRDVLLDAGGGVGNWASCLKCYFKKTIVLDISEEALGRIPEKDIEKKQGSVLNLPLKDNSVDCMLLIDVFEHITRDDLPKLAKEIQRVLKKKGRCLVFTNQFGWGVGFFWKRFLNSRHRLSKSDILDGHLNRLTFSEIQGLLSKQGLKITDYYHYSIFFQQFTDWIKDSVSRFVGKIRKERGIREGQIIKEGIKSKEERFFLKFPLRLLSFISLLDILVFGKLIPGISVFLNVEKV